MWPERFWADKHWPERYWAEPQEFLETLTRRILTRRFRARRWRVTLVDSSGTEYVLGWADASAANYIIPVGVPNGTYHVKIEIQGLAWKTLAQRSFATITIDRSSSSPITSALPLFSNFTYEIDEEYVKLSWDGDISGDDSGLISAGLWFSDGVPDFDGAPDIAIPLFSYNNTHFYRISIDRFEYTIFTERYWPERHWFGRHWPERYWGGVPSLSYVGLAPMSRTAAGGWTVGEGQYLAIPARIADPVPAVINSG